jgi:predicted methyltransferase
MKRLLLVALVPVMLAACVSASSNEEASTAAAAQPATAAVDTTAGLDASIQGAWRDPKNVARDQYRHPRETLSFFGIAPTDTVIEITPGGGWYAEILAPYLKDHGHYVAAVWDDAIAGQPNYRYGLNKTLRAKFAGNAAVYGTPEVRVFDPKVPAFGKPGSANAVVTFRNAHNWVEEGTAEAYFKAFYDVLTPGGTLGVVDHRAKPGTDIEKMKESGYLTEDLVIRLAKGAGFLLEAKSEVNANPKDTADHPEGVWSLPPTLRGGEVDRDKYLAIGESDRFTLRFRKPALK